MTKLINRGFLGFFAVLAIGIWVMSSMGCAKIVAPTGGAKDTIPPHVVPEKSTPNLSTNFKPQKIILTFDEWVQLNQPTVQIVVSPPFENPLDIELKGKKVIVNLENEELRENATYVISFGKGVQDYRERNPAENLRFVFSTGDFIDSLVVSGKVTDIETEKGAADVLVMLYDNLNDTVVRTERPFYFARTDKQGNFKIPYIKSDTFKVLALIDENLNYLYDTEAESIGFLNQNIIVTDSFKNKLDVLLFKPLPTLRRVSNVTKEFGHLRFVYNQELFDTLQIKAEPSFVSDYIEQEKDTLHFWYTDTTAQRTFIITDGKAYNDTADISIPNSDDFYKKNKFTRLAQPNSRTAQRTIKHNPNLPIDFTFRFPFYGIDTSKIIVTEDSTKKRILPKFSRSDDSKKNLSVNYRWKEKMTYQITMLPNAITDIFELKNDTIILNYQTEEAANFGTITVLLEGFSTDTSYVIELIDKKSEMVQTFLLAGKSKAKRTYKFMPTGDYSIRVIEDLNGNGRWDTGEYPSRQPEKIFLGKAETLKPNWDMELKFKR